MAIELTSPLAVVAHDAGAANLIIAWLKDFPELDIQLAVEGPAVKLFCDSFPKLKNTNVQSAMSGAAILLSGTSRNTDFEKRARDMANVKNIPSIGVVDHWTNYKMRFQNNDMITLPDEIWVFDEYAYSLAISFFSESLVHQKNNRYIEQTVDKVNLITSNIKKNDNKTHILYVLEPFEEFWKDSNVPAEYQALDYFLDNIFMLGINSDIEIHLKPHPSEPDGKYIEWCNQNTGFNISIDDETSLDEQIAWADWVVGCETFAMVIALSANKKTLSTLPPWAPPCKLPYKEILHLREMCK